MTPSPPPNRGPGEPPFPLPEAPTVSVLQRASSSLAGEIREYLDRHTTDHDEAIRAGGVSAGIVAARRLVAIYDGLLSTLFLCTRSLLGPLDGIPGVALAVVGSYGRGAMAPRSDIDLRILYRDDEALARTVADAILYPLWDARLAIGHQVVRADELLSLARTDLRTATTLLDWRHLAGDLSLWESVVERASRGLFSEDGASRFVQELDRDTLARHARFGGSVYLLEPDVKLGPGGARDLDVIHWVARARWKTQRLEDLGRLGMLVPREMSELVEAREHLWRVRNLLHCRAGRRAERLTFDEQERIAASLGHGDSLDATEAFMSTHYRHAATIHRVRESISERALQRARPRRPVERVVAPGLHVFDDHLTFASASDLASDPTAALRIYVEAVRRAVPIYPEARNAIRRAVLVQSFRKALFESPCARSLFLALCAVVRNTALRRDSILGDLHEAGLLTAMVPEFEPLVARVHHDAYHVFTVDMHSVAAVDFLRALARGDLSPSFPLACRIAAEIARPHVLFLATLLHDIGKAVGRHEHAERGAEIARNVALRLGLTADDARDVAHLVRHHLALYHIATRRDIDDPAVIDEVARVAAGREGLRELYLLTFADVSTTSPEAMTAWKAGLLDALFVAADTRLRGEATPEGSIARLTQDRLRALCAPLPVEPAVSELVDTMPERYLLGTAPERIRAHARVVAARSQGHPAIAVFSAPSGASAEVCVVADDRPGLLAAIAAALAANRLAVLEAQIYSRVRRDGLGEAVDIFFVRVAGDAGLDEVRRYASKAERDLAAMIDGTLRSEDVVGPHLLAPPRRSPPVESRIVFDNRASAGLSVIEVFSRDRPALLYLLARALRDLRLSIRIAKINTEGTRVADVFYVCEADGSKLESPERIAAVRSHVLQALDPDAHQGASS